MKNKIKILTICLLFLLCGCSVEYDLSINKDLTVSESVTAKEITNRMNSRTGLDTDSSVNYLYNMFKREGLDTTISKVESDNETIATVNGYHNSLEDYASNFSSDVFKKADISTNGDIVSLSFDQTKALLSNSPRTLVYDEIVVKIEVPFKVIEHNADSVNKNTYTWNIKKDKTLKNIKISFDKKQVKEELKVKLFNNTFSIKFEFIAVGAILLIILIIVCIVFINNKKNNRV